MNRRELNFLGFEIMEWRQSIHPHYEVSDEGQLRSLISKSNRVAGTLLKGSKKKGGYTEYKLSLNGVSYHYAAHRLVLFAFVGAPPTPDHQCAHYDGDPTNNHVSNLRWATAAENTEDKVRHGRHLEGHRKFTSEEILDMREMKASGKRYIDIRAKYKISKGNLSAIINRQTWAHI